MVFVGRTVGDDDSRTEDPDDDETPNGRQTDVYRHASSDDRRQGRTTNDPSDRGLTDCLRLKKSRSGGDLCRPGSSQTGASQSVETTTSRLFSPFPKQYVNRRRVDTAIKLGLYTVDDTTTGPQKTASGRSGRHTHS